MKMFKLMSVAGALALSSLAQAGSTAQSLHVNVPFRFVVAGQEFAAGEYDVQQSDSGIILVRGTGKSALTISYPGAAAKPGTPSSLRFQGNQAREYLVGVHVDGETDRSIPMHRSQERKVTLSQQ